MTIFSTAKRNPPTADEPASAGAPFYVLPSKIGVAPFLHREPRTYSLSRAGLKDLHPSSMFRVLRAQLVSRDRSPRQATTSTAAFTFWNDTFADAASRPPTAATTPRSDEVQPAAPTPRVNRLTSSALSSRAASRDGTTMDIPSLDFSSFDEHRLPQPPPNKPFGHSRLGTFSRTPRETGLARLTADSAGPARFSMAATELARLVREHGVPSSACRPPTREHDRGEAFVHPSARFAAQAHAYAEPQRWPTLTSHHRNAKRKLHDASRLSTPKAAQAMVEA